MTPKENRHGEITLSCWDGEYTFRLAIGDIEVLQETSGVGPLWLLNRLSDFDFLKNPQGGNWRWKDYAEIIRLAWLRADKHRTQDQARQLLDRFVFNRPPIESVVIARLILGEWLTGQAAAEEAEPVGKEEGPQPVLATAGPSTTEELPSRPSTAPEPPASIGQENRPQI